MHVSKKSHPSDRETSYPSVFLPASRLAYIYTEQCLSFNTPCQQYFNHGKLLRALLFHHGNINAIGRGTRLLDQTIQRCVFTTPSPYPRYPHNSRLFRLLAQNSRTAPERLPCCIAWVRSRIIMVRSWQRNRRQGLEGAQRPFPGYQWDGT
jgi:hypothetical protein